MVRRTLVLVCAFLAVAAAPALASPPRVDAAAYVVANAATGEVIASHNASARLPIASLTKLMTVLVALRHLQLDDVVTVRGSAAAVGESSIHLHAGERISVRDLVKGALIQSANDAADALASAAAGGDVDAFVAEMNARAKQLGLRETHFVRPDGLDARGHVSSARDILRLAQTAMHVRALREIVRERTDTIAGGRRLHTWNDLLGSFPGLIGVKTGHTGGAGWCEVAAAERPGYTIYVVVLGSPSRAERNSALAALLTWGLSRYAVGPVVRTRVAYAEAALPYGRAALALVVRKPLVRVFRVEHPLVQRIVAPAAVTLPVRRGQVLGRVVVYSGARLLGTRPLVASRSVARPGVGGRLRFYATRTLHHVWAVFS